MYIVQITAARKNPVDDGLDDVTYPGYVTPDILKAIEFAQRVDGVQETFSAAPDQGVKVFFTGPLKEYVGQEASERAIFVRRPYRDTTSADGIIWEEKWLEEKYEIIFCQKLLGRESAIPDATA